MPPALPAVLLSFQGIVAAVRSTTFHLFISDFFQFPNNFPGISQGVLGVSVPGQDDPQGSFPAQETQ